MPTVGHRPNLALLAILAVAVVSGAGSGCASSDEAGRADSTTATGAPCPVSPVRVVVTVAPWSDLVESLAGSCARVTTIVEGTSGDPHEFEPTPADNAALARARVVVRNGLGYDTWAEQALDTVSSRPIVVDAGSAAGRSAGDNPHVWYSPAAVDATARAVTDALTTAAPDAASYFDERAAAWQQQIAPFRALVASAQSSLSGRTYASTEPVFDDLADALGLRNVTPPGYQRAAANESDPAPGDLRAFEQALRDGEVDVLIVNTQTMGAVTDRLRATAESAGVPVVEVTETPPADAGSFVAWQTDQVTRLLEALAVPTGSTT